MIYSQTFYQILYFSFMKKKFWKKKKTFSENFNICDNNIINVELAQVLT
jgi:hypothetical protein